jgi:hypothetical protein
MKLRKLGAALAGGYLTLLVLLLLPGELLPGVVDSGCFDTWFDPVALFGVGPSTIVSTVGFMIGALWIAGGALVAASLFVAKESQ